MSNFQEKALKHLGLDSTNPNFSITDSDIWDLSNIQAGYDICQKEYEEKLRWIPIEEKLPEISSLEKYNVVNVKFKTFKTDEEMVCSATLEEISQHCFENSPKHKRWFIFPSAGHELKTVTHWRYFL